MSEDLVAFLRARYAEGVKHARWGGNMLITQGAPEMGVRHEVAERMAGQQVRAAETRQTFFEETVYPYLGTAGPTGRIAERQLLLLAEEHQGHADYRPEWAPDA